MLNGHAAPRRLPMTHEFLLKHVLTTIFRHGGERSKRFTWCWEAAYDHLGNGAMPVKTAHGRLWLNLRDQVMAKRILKWGVWERLETALFKAAVEPDSIVVDVGANVGYYTIIAADLARRGGRVFAFEPSPNHLSLLERSCSENGFDNVTTFRAALSDKTEDGTLYLSEGNLGDHRLFPAEEERAAIQVSCVPLDRVIDVVGVLKIDVQGAEGKVLRGAAKVIENSSPLTLFMEFWPEGLERAGEDPEEIAQFLGELGFDRIWIINEDARRAQRVFPKDIVACCRGYDGRSLLATCGPMAKPLKQALAEVSN